MSKAKLPSKPWKNPFNNADKSYHLEEIVNNIASSYVEQYKPYKRQGITIKQLLFNFKMKYPLDKKHGECIFTHKPTDWDEDKVRYKRLCNEPGIGKKWYDSKKKEHVKKYGKKTLLGDINKQKEMLHNRKIHNEYKYKGVTIGYVGKYELDFLERADKVYNIEIGDLETEKEFPYKYRGKERIYLLDFFIPSLGLAIEIKGDSPHRDIQREQLKKQSVLDAGYEYIFILNKDYDVLDTYLQDHNIKFNLPE